MQAMEQTMQIFPLAPLHTAALDELLRRFPAPVAPGAMAVALAVPLWVVDVVMAGLQEAGDAMPCAQGWQLSCSAGVALALTLPVRARAAGAV